MGKGECYGIVGLESVEETLNRKGALLSWRCTLLQQLRESCWFRIAESSLAMALLGKRRAMKQVLGLTPKLVTDVTALITPIRARVSHLGPKTRVEFRHLLVLNWSGLGRSKQPSSSCNVSVNTFSPEWSSWPGWAVTRFRGLEPPVLFSENRSRAGSDFGNWFRKRTWNRTFYEMEADSRFHQK